MGKLSRTILQKITHLRAIPYGIASLHGGSGTKAEKPKLVLLQIGFYSKIYKHSFLALTSPLC